MSKIPIIMMILGMMSPTGSDENYTGNESSLVEESDETDLSNTLTDFCDVQGIERGLIDSEEGALGFRNDIAPNFEDYDAPNFGEDGPNLEDMTAHIIMADMVFQNNYLHKEKEIPNYVSTIKRYMEQKSILPKEDKEGMFDLENMMGVYEQQIPETHKKTTEAIKACAAYNRENASKFDNDNISIKEMITLNNKNMECLGKIACCLAHDMSYLRLAIFYLEKFPDEKRTEETEILKKAGKDYLEQREWTRCLASDVYDNLLRNNQELKTYIKN